MVAKEKSYHKRNEAFGLSNRRRGRTKTKRKAPPPQQESEDDIIDSDIGEVQTFGTPDQGHKDDDSVHDFSNRKMVAL
jgi:hypothetical protein